MAENRLTRELDKRTAVERPTHWAPPELLPEPDKQAGYAYRWIRVASLNQADPRNLSAKLREGWEPVRIEEQPKFQMLVDPNSRYKDNIEIGGLLVCKAPKEIMDQRNTYYDRQAQAQLQSVDNNFLRLNDERMPLFSEKRTTVSFGKGK